MKRMVYEVLRGELSGLWSKTKHWSQRSLARLGRDPLVLAATSLLNDVSLRLEAQQAICAKIENEVSKAMELELDGHRTATNHRVIRAVNQPVSLSFQKSMEARDIMQRECNKAQSQLHNLAVLHSDTHQLVASLLKNDKLLHRFSLADQHLIASTFEQVRSRHAATVESMADICIGLERASSSDHSASNVNSRILPMVDIFLRGRLSVQLLCDHYVGLSKDKPNGGVSVDCSVLDVVSAAVTEAKHMCDANLNVSPEVELPKNDLKITVIRPWVHHSLVEVLKNGMASSVEKSLSGSGILIPPEMFVVLQQNDDMLSIEVIDQGVGLQLGSPGIERAFAFAQSSAPRRWDRLEEQQSYAMVRSPLQSLGVGLPLSRMMMNYFGGDVNLINRTARTNELDRGCTAVLQIPLDDTINENLPSF